jgi:hypothetical protein
MRPTPIRIPSGRPQSGELGAYAEPDVEHVVGDDAVAALATQVQDALDLFSPIAEDFASRFVYAPGKWTLKQVVGHMIDDERIFAYRALCIARGDARPLPGFDENDYVRFAGFEARGWEDLLTDYRIVRDATVALFSTFTPEVWRRRGNVNGYDASVRGLAFHLAGHELHHLRIVRERYLGRA